MVSVVEEGECLGFRSSCVSRVGKREQIIGNGILTGSVDCLNEPLWSAFRSGDKEVDPMIKSTTTGQFDSGAIPNLICVEVLLDIFPKKSCNVGLSHYKHVIYSEHCLNKRMHAIAQVLF